MITPTTATTATTDLIDRLIHVATPPIPAAITPSSAKPATAEGDGDDDVNTLRSLRAQRQKVRAAIELSREALFDRTLTRPTLRQRGLLAADLCERAGAVGLAGHYLDGTRAAGDSALAKGNGPADSDDTTPAMQRFARTLSDQPREGDRGLLDTLGTAGITPPAVITLAQLIGFLSFEIRVVAGLQALLQAIRAARAASITSPGGQHGSPETTSASKAANASTATMANRADPDKKPALGHNTPAPGSVIESHGFTNATLGWHAWLPLVDIDEASTEQLSVLEASHPNAKTSEYYRVLVHQPAILRQRSEAYNAIMYAPGGLPRADRELAAMVVSRVNGCVYCGSVHAQRFEQLARRNDAIVATFDDPDQVTTSARDAAIARFSAQLTRAPSDLNASAVTALFELGLSPLEVLDLIHVVAVFAWANRLMLNLGEPVPKS